MELYASFGQLRGAKPDKGGELQQVDGQNKTSQFSMNPQNIGYWNGMEWIQTDIRDQETQLD